MDFNEEIKNLQEEFNEIFERNKENLGAKKEVKKIVKDMGYYKDYLKAHNIDFPDPNLAKMKGDLERAKNKLKSTSEAKEENEYDKNMEIANDYDKLFMKQPAKSPDGSANSVANYYKTKYEEYFDKAMKAKGKKELKEQLEELQSQFNEIFEATPGEKKVKEDKNKIRKPGKNKKGEPVEVVSVADELFPYEGSAKEQMDKKILAKINDMIQGQATLQDLIGLVRSKKAVVASNESLDERFAKLAEAIEVISEVHKHYEQGL